MKQNKQKALERLREIEKEKIKNLLDFKEKLINDNNFNELNCFNGLSMSLIKEAQKIKNDWEDGCGSNDFDKKRDYCGLVTKYLDKNNKLQRKKVYFCPTCKAQNKEKDEICGRILG